MAEKAETVHVVMRREIRNAHAWEAPVKVSDDRMDARAYAARMNGRNSRYHYRVESCKKL